MDDFQSPSPKWTSDICVFRGWKSRAMNGENNALVTFEPVEFVEGRFTPWTMKSDHLGNWHFSES